MIPEAMRAYDAYRDKSGESIGGGEGEGKAKPVGT
jgi:hypothetical protein